LPGWSEIELRRSILWTVGVRAAEGNPPAPKSSPDTRFCGWWGRLIVIETIKYLKNGVGTLYARPLPVSCYPLSSRKVVVTSMLGGVFVGVECVDGWWRIETGHITDQNRH